MWRTTLSFSFLPIIFSTSFYFILIYMITIQLYTTFMDSFSFIIVFLLLLEWWRSLKYFFTIKGEFALFRYINQIYWHQQRWFLVYKPLIFHSVMILNLKSRRNDKHQVLFLIRKNFSKDGWRELRYHLHQIYEL